MKMKIIDILNVLYEFAPLFLQESYDNCGLIVGDELIETGKALLCIDVTEEVIKEAIEKECGLVISHHPLIFKGIKQIVPRGHVERTAIMAIRNNIAIAAMHTNLDNCISGVNKRLADRLGLKHHQVLQSVEGALKKLVVFCPEAKANEVRNAIFEAGAGQIGNYDSCSFNLSGTGTFMAGSDTNPFVGNIGQFHQESEIRIETILPSYLTHRVINAMLKAHPYEEVAYDLYPLDNAWNGAGAGMVGVLPQPLSEKDFLKMASEVLQIPVLRHSPLRDKKIEKVAVCGGSGAFLLPVAKKANADVFLTADIKYHDFFEADGALLMVDAGHFETEQFTKELIADILREKIPNFAVLISEVNTNAVGYYFK